MPEDTVVSSPPLPPYPPYAPFPPFPPYPPYPPVVLQCCHGTCGGGGQHGGQAPPVYVAPPGYGMQPGVAQPGQPSQPGSTGTPAGGATGGTRPGAGGFNPLDPVGSLLNMFGSLFGGGR